MCPGGADCAEMDAAGTKVAPSTENEETETIFRPGDSPIVDFLPVGHPVEATLEQLVQLVHEKDFIIHIYQFSALNPDETLQDHLQKHIATGSCPGPFLKSTMKFASQRAMRMMNLDTFEAASEQAALWWHSVEMMRQEWQTHTKNMLSGNYRIFVSRGLIFGETGKTVKTRALNVINVPTILHNAEGQRFWGMMRQVVLASPEFREAWSFRDLLAIKHTPSCITVVSQDSCCMLWQNSQSMAMFGCHGVFNTETEARPTVGGGGLPAPSDLGSGSLTYNFLVLLFEGRQEDLERLKLVVRGGTFFSTRVEIVNPQLRMCMGLKEGDRAYHDVQVAGSQDPINLQRVFTISQIDVTDTVIAQQQLQQAHAQLALEKERVDALLQRQHELIACLGWVSDLSKNTRSNVSGAELMASVRQQISANHQRNSIDSRRIEVLQLLGSGTFAKVYKALWHGTIVALKCMVLQRNMSGAEKMERMAIMEAAISRSLSHPNIVQTYTYKMKPVMEGLVAPASTKEAAGGSADMLEPQDSPSNGVQRYEVQLVLEFCDCGSIRDSLDKGAFLVPGGAVNYRAVLETAADIANGMKHLHDLNVLHLDLKSSNVLLRSNTSDARGVTAKIADFGLSIKMDYKETHVSKLYHGTLTHMAPEVLLMGHQSKAADVYAFGITLWEIYTGGKPFEGVAQMLLGHMVVHDRRRPVFPPDAPLGYVNLARRCWDDAAYARPTFQEITETLMDMRKAEGGKTPSLIRVHKSSSQLLISTEGVAEADATKELPASLGGSFALAHREPSQPSWHAPEDLIDPAEAAAAVPAEGPELAGTPSPGTPDLGTPVPGHGSEQEPEAWTGPEGGKCEKKAGQCGAHMDLSSPGAAVQHGRSTGQILDGQCTAAALGLQHTDISTRVHTKSFKDALGMLLRKLSCG